jgi:hypothetical protein
MSSSKGWEKYFVYQKNESHEGLVSEEQYFRKTDELSKVFEKRLRITEKKHWWIDAEFY